MSELILRTALGLSQILLGMALCLACWRVLRGPRAYDRVLGVDTLYITTMLMLLVTGMLRGSAYFFEAALIIGFLGFVSSVALAKFLLRGEVIE